MLSVIARSNRWAALPVLLALLVAGAATQPLCAPVWARLRAGRTELRQELTGVALGQGASLGLLSGFRAVLADFAWLRVAAQWERQDLPGTQTAIRVVTMLDPRPLVFWVNGARMLACDMPGWRIEAAGGYDRVPQAVQARIDEEQAMLGLRLLDEALTLHPDNPTLYIEQANLHILRRHDLAAAAECYRRAAMQPGAPFYAARLYGELLRKLGRPRDAYAWLTQLHPTLPANDEAAAADIVLERIRELERVLGVTAEAAYRPESRRK